MKAHGEPGVAPGLYRRGGSQDAGARRNDDGLAVEAEHRCRDETLDRPLERAVQAIHEHRFDRRALKERVQPFIRTDVCVARASGVDSRRRGRRRRRQ